MPLVAIVTAVKPSDAHFLTGAYESLKQQTLTDWEWIVVEDGEHPTLAGSLKQDERVRYLCTGGQAGPANARNLALGVTEAAYFRNLDSDDELHDPSVLARTVDAFGTDKAVAYVVGAMVDLLESGERQRFADNIEAGQISPGTLFRGWVENNGFGLVHPTCLAVKTSVLLRAGGYPGLAVSEDTALLLPLSQEAVGYFLSEPVTVHRKRSGSITGQLQASGDPLKQVRHDLITSMCEAVDRGV